MIRHRVPETYAALFLCGKIVVLVFLHCTISKSLKSFYMSKSKQQESQQQSQGVTIGTQGNSDQPTPLGDDIHYPQPPQSDDRSIPNQDRSSATNQQRASEGAGENE